MLFNALSTQPIETYGTTLSDGWQYFFLFLLFAGIIVAVVVVIYFAKWLTMGPKLKKRWRKILRKDSGNEAVHGVQVKGKEIIIDSNYEAELRRLIVESNSPQEKLEYQNKLDTHIKEKQRAEEQIRKIEEEKLAKIESKEETARIRQEAKIEAKRIKEENKRNKELAKKQ